jgi:hypothetical protein
MLVYQRLTGICHNRINYGFQRLLPVLPIILIFKSPNPSVPWELVISIFEPLAMAILRSWPPESQSYGRSHGRKNHGVYLGKPMVYLGKPMVKTRKTHGLPRKMIFTWWFIHIHDVSFNPRVLRITGLKWVKAIFTSQNFMVWNWEFQWNNTL